MNAKLYLIVAPVLTIAFLAASVGPVLPAHAESPRKGPGAVSPTVANYGNILSTGFEAEDGFDLGHSICGAEFAKGLTCFQTLVYHTPADCLPTHECVPKDHAASQNCCPDDPNETNGWSMSFTSRHCLYPIISDAHPFEGSQHMRFSQDTEGGCFPGCTGEGAACRQRAITPRVPVAEISRTTWSLEIAISDVFILGFNLLTGQETGPETLDLTSRVLWYYGGALYVYDLHVDRFAYGLHWDDDIPNYSNFTIDLDPCRDQVVYTYNGVVFRVEPYGFTHPLGDPVHDDRPPTTDRAFFTWGNFYETVDIDNHVVTHTPCADACCDGVTGLCTHASQAECAGLSDQTVWYENVPCEMLGAPDKVCEGGADHGNACEADSQCASPGVCVRRWPPACERHSGACCNRAPGAGGPEPEGTCLDNVYPEDCDGVELTWHKGGTCADSACFETSGACCDMLEGVCTDGSFQGECVGAQRLWSQGAACAEVDCDAVVGACCDRDTFGGCTQTTSTGCTCPRCDWFKRRSCDDIECGHVAIPTVSAWGLVVLTLLVLIGAKLGMRYRALRQP